MKKLAWTLAFTAVFLFIIPIIAYLFWHYEYTPNEYATFVGGTAGPIAALAGFLFVYINFQQQQEQIKKHDEQFERQSFEYTFFNLLNYYRDLSDNFQIKYANYPYSQKMLSIEEIKIMLHDKIKMPVSMDRPKVPLTLEQTRKKINDHFLSQQQQVDQLVKPLLSIVEHILYYDKKYFSILCSQISDSHLFLYFYFYIANCESSTSWTYRKNMHSFLKEIKTEILVDKDHLKWINRPPYKPEHPL